MEKCPPCGAAVTPETTICRRCKTDLSLLLKMETEALMHGEKALASFQKQAFAEMFYHAKRSAAIISTPESRKLLVGAAVLAGKYETACKFGA